MHDDGSCEDAGNLGNVSIALQAAKLGSCGPRFQAWCKSALESEIMNGPAA